MNKNANSVANIPAKYTVSGVDFKALGFRPSTDLEIAKGNPPFIFDFAKSDSSACAAAKSLFNNSSRQLFEANQDHFSALEPFIQTMALTHTINKSQENIAKHCLPGNFKL